MKPQEMLLARDRGKTVLEYCDFIKVCKIVFTEINPYMLEVNTNLPLSCT